MDENVYTCYERSTASVFERGPCEGPGPDLREDHLSEFEAHVEGEGREKDRANGSDPETVKVFTLSKKIAQRKTLLMVHAIPSMYRGRRVPRSTR